MNSNIIYQSKEWLSLELDIRVDLVPTIEKIRPGAEIEFWRKCYDDNREEQINLLEHCLTKIGIKHRNHESTYYISWEESWINKLWGKETPEGEIIYELTHGQFLGYPQCCIDSFEKGCQEYLKKKDLDLWLNFGKMLKKQ